MKFELDESEVAMVLFCIAVIIVAFNIKGCDAENSDLKNQLWKQTNSIPKG